MIKSPSFFKLYLPCHSSHHLRLPPAYVKRFNGDILKDVILKDTSGNMWHMEIKEDENGVSFKHGWQKFATDHSLEYGEFLVFEYNGNSLFNVNVYGKNGCMKNQSSANKFVELDDELNEAQSRQRSIGKEKLKEQRSRISRKFEGSCDATQRKKTDITSNPTKFAMTTKPHFIASVSPRTPYHVNIPKSLVMKNGLNLEPEMVFHTREGKQWPVKVNFKADRLLFTKGWVDFWRENHLRPQDKCRFEFVFRKNKTLSKKILVTFLRTRTKK